MNKKSCTKCLAELDLDCFRYDSAKDKHRSDCVKCERKSQAIYRQKNREALLERNRAWQSANRDKARAASNAWKANNPDKAKESHRNWWTNNRGIRYANTQRRKSRLLENSVFSISKREIERLYASPCFYCGTIGNTTADHIVPISRGGQHSIGNLVPACKTCNSSKKDSLLTEWKKRKTTNA